MIKQEVTMSNQPQKKDIAKVPEPTLRRLPWYLSNVKLLKQKGEQYVSSTQISKEINVDASQIAKDLSYVNISGRTRVGYEVDALIEVLEDFLGFTDMHKAFLFGVHVDLVIGVQYPLCLGFTAFCIQFLELPPFLFLGMSLF